MTASPADEHSAVLSAAEDSDATSGGAASGILDRACAQRSGSCHVGTERSCHSVEQRDVSYAAAHLPGYSGLNVA